MENGWTERIKELEKENAELKEKIKVLHSKIVRLHGLKGFSKKKEEEKANENCRVKE